MILEEKLHEIAEIIEKRPVLGHWPHMRAADDAATLRLAADRLQALAEHNKAIDDEIELLWETLSELDPALVRPIRN